MVCLRRGELLIRRNVHEVLKILDALLVDLDLGNPAAAVRIVLRHLVDNSRRVLEDGVDVCNLAANWGIDVCRALDRLDSTDGVAGLDLLAQFGELDKDDIAERLGGVLANANNTGLQVSGQVDPFVLFGVFSNLVCAKGGVNVSIISRRRFRDACSALTEVCGLAHMMLCPKRPGSGRFEERSS